MKHRKAFSPQKTIALGFALVILLGTMLLCLPIASRSGEGAPFATSIFTAASATCVTGLVRVDTYAQWSLFGQIVILLLIQIGGLGFMSIATFVSFLVRRKINLSERGLIQESVNSLHIGGIVRLMKKVLYGTILFEGVGALLLMIRFIPRFGAARGIWFSVFHSVSAFCNAGFDLMGFEEPYASLTTFVGDPLINGVIMLLIVVGGIGFFVWEDVSKNKWHVRRYMLHTKIVLTMTMILIVGGALMFYCYEANGLFAGMRPGEAVLASLFTSVTARTAGFNTVDMAHFSTGSFILFLLLMFVGGSPGSTAGGVKTTTAVVVIASMFSRMRHQKNCTVFQRRLEDDALRKASFVMILNSLLAFSAALIISLVQSFPMEDLLFEVFSAIGTVGVSTGITRELTNFSSMLIILLMYCGRVGSLSVALIFTRRSQYSPIEYPTERISIG